MDAVLAEALQAVSADEDFAYELQLQQVLEDSGHFRPRGGSSGASTSTGRSDVGRRSDVGPRHQKAAESSTAHGPRSAARTPSSARAAPSASSNVPTWAQSTSPQGRGGKWEEAAWAGLEEFEDEQGLLCEICQEQQPLGSMLELPCQHSFCLLCLAQHGRTAVEAKRLPVRCPFPGCALPLDIEQCELFLEEQDLGRALLCLAELSISAEERFFCPHQDCSVLMLLEPQHQGQQGETRAQCCECGKGVCIACRVPWHEGATCAEFQAAPEHERAPDDFKLKNLADSLSWRRCPQCKAMVERAQGCRHMTCRCKAEFCYKCGLPWINKKRTCKCSLF